MCAQLSFGGLTVVISSRENSTAKNKITKGKRAPLKRQAPGEPIPTITYRGSELKAISATPFTSVSTGVSSFDLTGQIIGGTDLNQRIGRAIHAHYVVVDWIVQGGQVNLAADDNVNTIRFSLCDAFNVAPGANYSLTIRADPRLIIGTSKFYWDKLLQLESSGRDSTGYMPAVSHVRATVPINRKYTYTGAGAYVCAPETLSLLAISDSVVAPSPGVTSGAITLYYTDL
jgi:hypothetical protein